MTNLEQATELKGRLGVGALEDRSALRVARARLDAFGRRRLLIVLDVAAAIVVAATFLQAGPPELLFHVVFVILTAEAFVFGRRICLQRVALLSVALLAYVSLPALGVDAEPLELTEWPLMFIIAVLVAWMADREQSVGRRYAALYRETRDRLVRAQEEERGRLARDLHDGVGQTLTALTLTLDAAAASVDRRDVETRDLERARELAREAIDDTRQIAEAIRPPRLTERGLAGALRAAASTPGGHVTMAIAPGADIRLPADAELEVFRIVQEAVRNATNHAKADGIAVSLVSTASGPCVEVSDNGVGFDLSRIGDGRLGLVGMRERAEAIGGTLEIESGPNRGTRVRLRIPAELVATRAGAS